MAARRQIPLASAIGALVPRIAFAQARKVPRVGVLHAGSSKEQTILIEYRYAEGDPKKLPALADPVQKGIVDSLRRPGGNMTGVWGPVLPLSAKKLEIALEVLPQAKRFLVVADVDSKDQLEAVKEAASKRSVEVLAVEYTKRPYDLEAAFKRARDAKVDGLIGVSSPGIAIHRVAIAEQLARYKLPAFVGRALMVESGFLVSYTTNLAKAARQVASVGVRILKGERPSEVAVEQVDEFELVVNLKAARALGVKIPYTVLARATKVIE